MEPERKSKSLWSKQKIEILISKNDKIYFLGICANYDKWSLTRIETVYVIHDKVAKSQFPVAKGRKRRSGLKILSTIFDWS